MRLSTILLVSAFLALESVDLSAQTYSRISLTNFVLNGGKYVALTNITVGANTLVSMVSDYRTANAPATYVNGGQVVYGGTMAVQYPGGPWATPAGSLAGPWVFNDPVLGPCTLQLTATATNNINPAAYAILEYRTGNYSRISLTNFVMNGGKYVATTNIPVGANTLVSVVSDYRTANAPATYVNGQVIYGGTTAVQYPGGPWAIPAGSLAGPWVFNDPVIGPCTLQLTATATNNINPAAYAILEISTVQ